jgi:hypothetical protein
MKTYIVNILAAVIIVMMPDFCNLGRAADKTGKSAAIQVSENEIKAVFLYNFLKFTEWPEDKPSEPNMITIGIIGKDEFGNLFDAVSNKPINNKTLAIKRFGKFGDLCRKTNGNVQNPCANLEDLKKCHLLFVCKSETPQLKQILGVVSNSGVLTAGECEEFLDAGGMINFIQSEDKVVFEINTTAAKQAKIQINSRVLRLAKRVKND